MSKRKTSDRPAGDGEGEKRFKTANGEAKITKLDVKDDIKDDGKENESESTVCLSPEEKFRAKIKESGGTVIGDYVGRKVAVECRCAKGHVCSPKPASIIAGYGMCRACVGKDPKEAERKFRAKIAELNGKVIGEYKKSAIGVDCICSEGHPCKPTPNGILNGRGMCITCSGRDPKVAEAKFRARIAELGGVVVGEYVNNATPIDCVCSEGHEVAPIPTSVIQGNGICKICVGLDPKEAERKFRARVAELGGKVIGEYKGSHIPIDCECENKHPCKPSPAAVNHGGGICFLCARQIVGEIHLKEGEAKFRAKVEELGGRVVGTYLGMREKVDCVCPEGHNCAPYPQGVRDDGRGLCGICTGRSEDCERRFRARIVELGGVVIGEYKKTQDRVDCKCKNGHFCNPIPTGILIGEGMCRICVGHDPMEAERKFRAHVDDMGGLMVGDYINAATPVACICSEGHECNPRPNGVNSSGRGICAICAGNDSKEAERKFRARIAELGGQVVGEYTNSATPISCICKNQHQCSPRPGSVIQGLGMCRTCAGLDPREAERKFRERIALFKGKVIGQYVNNSTPIECECSKGHDCFPIPASVIAGCRMCPQCHGYVGELRLLAILQKFNNKQKVRQQVKFPEQRWKFDFEHCDCLFELDGGQHFGVVWGGEEGFKLVRQRDIEKTNLAISKGKKLIRIHYDWLNHTEASQMAFLKAAIAAKGSLIVSHATKYQFLSSFNPLVIS